MQGREIDIDRICYAGVVLVTGDAKQVSIPTLELSRRTGRRASHDASHNPSIGILGENFQVLFLLYEVASTGVPEVVSAKSTFVRRFYSHELGSLDCQD